MAEGFFWFLRSPGSLLSTFQRLIEKSDQSSDGPATSTSSTELSDCASSTKFSAERPGQPSISTSSAELCTKEAVPPTATSGNPIEVMVPLPDAEVPKRWGPPVLYFVVGFCSLLVAWRFRRTIRRCAVDLWAWVGESRAGPRDLPRGGQSNSSRTTPDQHEEEGVPARLTIDVPMVMESLREYNRRAAALARGEFLETRPRKVPTTDVIKLVHEAALTWMRKSQQDTADLTAALVKVTETHSKESRQFCQETAQKFASTFELYQKARTRFHLDLVYKHVAPFEIRIDSRLMPR